MSRIICMIPTYNEAENIGPLLDALLAISPEVEALVVDDNSPDGTWKLVGERASKEPRIHLLHRTRDKGRGLAGIAGFHEALRLGADAVIEMDADWSHDPKWIPSMIEAWRRGGDLVIGSRLIPGGGEEGRGFPRRIITHLANMYIHLMLWLPARDLTSGYRLYSRRCLEALPWEAMNARGPEILQETALAAHARGFKIVEVPIIFVERRFGQSTFNRGIMLRSIGAMTRLRWHPGRLLTENESDKLIGLPLVLAWPLAIFYGIGRRVDRALHVWGILPRRKLPVPVACVGNLTVGGTGKTPFVAMLAGQFAKMGRRTAILSRGYRAEHPPDKPLIVSDGVHLLARTEEAGDESRQLAETRQGVAVVVHPDRYRAGESAIRLLESDMLVLDDGFQHDKLERDLDIVLWDLRDDPRRMHLLPAGRLREPLTALRRAGAIVLTHREYLLPAERARRTEATLHRLKSIAPSVEVFEAVTLVTGWRHIGGRMGGGTDIPDGGKSRLGSWPWTGRRVIAISGVARPGSFESTIRATGGILARHFAYTDHHVYDSPEIEYWRAERERLGIDLILTTAKDAVKLEHLPLAGLPIVAVDICMDVTEPERWDLFLRDRLALNGTKTINIPEKRA